MELGKNIIKIRKDNKLTQDEFADKYYVTRQTISNWENGKSYPDLETLVKISDDFNISLDVLLKGDNEMVKEISKKQKDYKLFKIFVLVLNIIGILCLIYFLIPYLKHDMSINNPNAMISSFLWDECGMALTIGLIPLIIANIMAYIFIDIKHKYFKLLCFIPSVICLLTVLHYWIFATDWSNEDVSKIEASIKCNLNNDVYQYDIYLEDDGSYSLGIDDKDKFSVDNVDYTNKDTIINSINDYYKTNGGECN